MLEQMIRIGPMVSYKPHFSLMNTWIVETSFHMYTNENLKL
jgi:hypothetical protein